MRLAEYLRRTGRSLRSIHLESGVSYPTLIGIATHGDPCRNVGTARKISRATSGLVSVAELLGLTARECMREA